MKHTSPDAAHAHPTHPLPVYPTSLQEKQFMIDRYTTDLSLFALGNGYLGVRGHFEEDTPNSKEARLSPQSVPATYINGFYETYPIRYPEGGYGYPQIGEALVAVPEGTGMTLYVDEEIVDISRGEVLYFNRQLDFHTGTLSREVHWRSPQGREIHFRITRFVSQAEKHLMTMRLDVLSLKQVTELSVHSTLIGEAEQMTQSADHRVGANLSTPIYTLKHLFTEGASGGGVFETRLSKRRLAVYLSHTLEPSEDLQASFDVSKDEATDGGRLTFALTLKHTHDTTPPPHPSASNPWTLVKTIAYVDDRSVLASTDGGAAKAELDAEQALLQKAKDIVETAQNKGYNAVWTEHLAHLKTFWDKSDVIIEGDAASQQAIRFSLLHLYQSTGRDGLTSIGAKGLTGPGYEGHYFWDTELYIFPFFLLTQPHIARNLLVYRYHLLPAARIRARELGYPGALYPWRTISGRECSTFFPAGTAQIHINADIMYALKQYVDWTGDQAFLWQYGLEMAVEIARFYIKRGTFCEALDGRFTFFTVTGPDEYTALVDHNAYTNVMAAFALRYTVDSINLFKDTDPIAYEAFKTRMGLRSEEVDAWHKAAERMYLPYDEKLDVIAQDATFLTKPKLLRDDIPEHERPLLMHRHYLDIYRYQVAKQPDALMICLFFPEMCPQKRLERMFDYYEPITTHDSSLSPPIFSMLAARLGRTEEAVRYFHMTARMDIDDVNRNAKDGIHAASMGGTYMTILFGFAGLRLKEAGGKPILTLSPHLPKTWQRLTFTVFIHGDPLKVSIDHQTVQLTHAGKTSLLIELANTHLLLNPGEQRHLPYA